MNTALWIVAGVMAALFAFAGANKLFIPYDKLAKAPGATWVSLFSPGFVKALGAIEIVGAGAWSYPQFSTSRRSWCRWPRSAWR